MPTYLKLIQLQQQIEAALKQFENPSKLSRTEIGDIKFHVSLFLCCILTSSSIPKINKILTVDFENIDLELINKYINITLKIYKDLGGNNAIAKGKEFVNSILQAIKDEISSQNSNNQGFKL